jgi:hypothetical protein
MKTRNTQAGNQNELLPGRELGHDELNLPRPETKTIGFHWTGNRPMKNGSLSGEGWASMETESGATKMRVILCTRSPTHATILVTAHNAAPVTYTSRDKQTRFSKQDKDNGKTIEMSCIRIQTSPSQ